MASLTARAFRQALPRFVLLHVRRRAEPFDLAVVGDLDPAADDVRHDRQVERSCPRRLLAWTRLARVELPDDAAAELLELVAEELLERPASRAP